MNIITYTQVNAFLARVQPDLERNELLHGLPLGIAHRLQQFPERIQTPPYLAIVEDNGDLIIAAVMTPPFRLLITSNQLSDFAEALSLLIHNLRTHDWSVPGVMGPSFLSDLFAEQWTTLTGETSDISTHERLFELTQVISPHPGPGSLRPATLDDTTLVIPWIKAFQQEALGLSFSDEDALSWAQTRINNGEVYLWVLPDKTSVSLVCSTRPLTRVITIAPVYTPPEHRGHGYASRSVATLSQQLLDRGWERCCLFTDLSNPTSNSIYQQVGYRPVCDFNEYNFKKA